MKTAYGQPVKVVGDETIGFLYYDNGVRFGYTGGVITELGIVFFGQENIIYPVELPLAEEHTQITELTRIHEFISIINHAGIKWKSNDEKNLNVFSLKTEGEVYALFDLEDGKITKIACRPR